MARKRSHTPDEGGDDSLSQYIPQNRPTKRRRRDGPFSPSSSVSVNHIKGKLRNVTRTLERSKNLPADVRVEKERALAGYKLDLENAENEKRKQQMIKKYHMVRFFERQKATRKLRRLKKLLSNATRESEEYVDLEDKIHRAQVDLNYTLYCPLGEKYTSLYKRKDAQGNHDATMADDSTISQGSQSGAQQPAMWALVEQCMADNTLEALREGKLKGTLRSNLPQRSPAANAHNSRSGQKGKSRKDVTKHSEAAQLEAQGNDSDEGFFEEWSRERLS